MSGAAGLPGSLEEVVLLALARCGDDAYGMSVRRELLEAAGHDASIGSVYSTLDRMETKGWVSSRLGDPDPVRGGHPRRYFALTAEGWVVLRAARRLRNRLWTGLEPG